MNQYFSKKAILVEIFLQLLNHQAGVYSELVCVLIKLEGTALYAVLIPAPAEAFGQIFCAVSAKKGLLCPMGQTIGVLCCFCKF